MLLAGAVSHMTEKDRLLPDLPRQQKRYSCSIDMVYTNILAQMSWIQSAILGLRKAK